MSGYDPNLVSTNTPCRLNQRMGCYAAQVPIVGFSGGYLKKMRIIRDFVKNNTRYA